MRDHPRRPAKTYEDGLLHRLYIAARAHGSGRERTVHAIVYDITDIHVSEIPPTCARMLRFDSDGDSIQVRAHRTHIIGDIRLRALIDVTALSPIPPLAVLSCPMCQDVSGKRLRAGGAIIALLVTPSYALDRIGILNYAVPA